MSFLNRVAIIEITVQPRSANSRLVVNGDFIKVYLHSPPVDGKANEECVTLIAKNLGIAKSLIQIEKGEKGKKKRISVQGLTREEVFSKLRNKIK